MSYGEPHKYDEDIGLINNAIMYLFDRVTVVINYLKGKLRAIHSAWSSFNYEGLLTCPSECNSAGLFIWALD